MSIELSRNLGLRIVSALALLPPVVGAVYFGGWWFYIFILVAGTLMLLEWNRLVDCSYPAMDVIGIGAIALAPLLFLDGLFITLPPVFLPLFLIVLTGLAGFIEFKKIRVDDPRSQSIYYSLLGIIIIATALGAFSWLRSQDNGLLVMWTFLCVWAMDVGGYFAGKGIGGPKLSPRVSPNKTWAGLVGGMLLAAIVSVVFATIFDWGPLFLLALAGALIALIAQFGDLYESAVKRRFGAKDSGELIPGHGGILDRVDGLLSAAPAIALFLSIYMVWV